MAEPRWPPERRVPRDIATEPTLYVKELSFPKDSSLLYFLATLVNLLPRGQHNEMTFVIKGLSLRITATTSLESMASQIGLF